MMGEWSEGQWIVDVMSFQKMYGLHGLYGQKYHKMEISGDVTEVGQLVICETQSLAIIPTSFDVLVKTLMLITADCTPFCVQIYNRRNREDKKEAWP